MEELNDLMQSEYEAMAHMEKPMPDSYRRALEIIRSKLPHKDYLKVEEEITEIYINAEKFGFKQGFMRGIVVAKGGAA